MPQMINCPYCRRLTDPKLDSCPHCGGYLRRKPSSSAPSGGARQTCPNCKALVQEGDIICVACGTNLLTGQQATDQSFQDDSRRSWPYVVAGVIAVVLVIAVGAAFYFATLDPVKRAMDLRAEGRDLEASDMLESYVADNPDDSAALFELGKLQWETNRIAEAAQSFGRVTQLDPDNVAAARYHAVCLAASGGRGTLDQQIQSLERVVELDPRDVPALFLLGLARGVRGDVAGQIDALERVVELEAENDSAEYFLGVGQAIQGNYAGAERTLTAARGGGGPLSAEATAALGFLETLQGEREAAKRYFNDSAGTTISIGKEALVQLGVLYMQSGDYSEAEKHLRRAVGQPGPDVPGARLMYALTLQALGYDNDAMGQYEQILDRGRTEDRADASVQMAHIYLSRGEMARARDAIARADELNARGALFYVTRGRILARDQDLNRALDNMKRAVEVDPNFAPAHLELGLLHIRQEAFSDGLRELRTFLELNEGVQTAEIEEIRTLVEQLAASQGMT